MSKRFEAFMRNPYYMEMYENAPTERLKQHLRYIWDDPSVQKSALKTPLTRSEVEYLAKYAVGGMEKAFFRRWLAAFDQRDPS